MDEPIVIALVQCCRVWEVAAYLPYGHCGLCGEKPTMRAIAHPRRWLYTGEPYENAPVSPPDPTPPA